MNREARRAEFAITRPNLKRPCTCYIAKETEDTVTKAVLKAPAGIDVARSPNRAP